MEKTEKPTQNRLKKAREEGQTFSSKPFESFVKILLVFVVISYTSEAFLLGFKEYLNNKYIYMKSDICLWGCHKKFLGGSFSLIIVLMILPFVAILIAIFYRPNLASRNILERNISNYFKSICLSTIFSKEKFIRLGQDMVYMLLFGALTLFYIKSDLFIPDRYMLNHENIPMILLKSIYNTLLFSLLFGLIMGVIDMMIERHKYVKSLYMTKQEIKEEFKNQEGDPEIKYKQKKLRQAILFSDMKRDVKRAKFVLVNPTHIAIPIIYSESDFAPLIGYIGVDKEATEMINFAAVNLIPVVKNVSLAREFYRIYEPGDEINEEHYEIMASIISLISTFENRIDYIDMDKS
ncbi:MAG: EscU/YscU/HrcU family type III secretion system export apparatus switch protein [Deltaproteobacteria bacterium]|nr:EscU/YscU/HrcU family type III secretion system export apparatus switch protein [Deltaproteobacteria bacterium]